MKKTIRFKNIDGFDIITGFGRRLPDPEATKKNVSKVIDKLPEAAELKAKITEDTKNTSKAKVHYRNFMSVYRNISQQIIAKDSKISPTRGMVLAAMAPTTKKKLEDDEKSYNGFMGVKVSIQNDLIDITSRLKQKSKDVKRQNPVYFELPPGEIAKTDVDYDELFSKVQGKEKNTQIDINGVTIGDLRNREYYLKIDDKWEASEILKLGDGLKTGEFFTEDLTPTQQAEISDQKNTERIAELTADEKINELTMMKAGILSRSGQMRSELEILGDKDALTKAQEWYNSEIEVVQRMYG